MKIASDILPYNNAKRPQYKYRVFFYDGLKKTYKVFKTKSTALDFIQQVKVWNKESTETTDATTNASNTTVSANIPLTKSAIAKYQSIERVCEHYKTTIEEILAFWVKGQKRNTYNVNISTAVVDYFRYIDSTSVTTKHKEALNYFISRFVQAVNPKTPLISIDAITIENWLKSLKVQKTISAGKLIETNTPIADYTFNNYHKYLQTFFNWCIKKGLTDTNPVNEIDKRKIIIEEIQFYNIAQCEEWLKKAIGKTKLYVAMALFTGIRKAELLRLKYENIYIQDKEIVLSAGITKTLQRRIVKIPDNLIKYLEEADVDNKTGVIFNSVDSVKCGVKRLAKKLTFKTIKNGFRHSAASYYLAKTGNEYETARQLGHSVEILKKHYAGLVRASEAEKFYKL